MMRGWIALIAFSLAACNQVDSESGDRSNALSLAPPIMERDCSQPTEGYAPPQDAIRGGHPARAEYAPLPNTDPEARLAAQLYAIDGNENVETIRNMMCFWIAQIDGQRCVYFSLREISVGGDGTYCFDPQGRKTFEFLGE
ncbi:MAG: hypothetical protein ABL874_01215 [Sphingopyxis sp.]